jgi:hypothetical protein
MSHLIPPYAPTCAPTRINHWKDCNSYHGDIAGHQPLVRTRRSGAKGPEEGIQVDSGVTRTISFLDASRRSFTLRMIRTPKDGRFGWVLNTALYQSLGPELPFVWLSVGG